MTTALHVMRTYGVHGGERQLAQLFANFPNQAITHHFCFVYRDTVCKTYFSRIPGLVLSALLPLRARAFPSLLLELLCLFFCLPALQLRLLQRLRRENVQICVAHGFQGAMVAWFAACLLRNISFVYVHRGTKSRLGKIALFRILYAPFAKVAGVSHASADSLSDLVPVSKRIVLENGIDWQAIETQKESCAAKENPKLVVTSVGRLIAAKGQRFLLDAFAIFHRTHPESELWLIGDGPDAALLQQQAISQEVAEHVRFLGPCDSAICPLAQSDIFVHASETEGLSNAVLEAMVLKLPSVVVAAPGVSECHRDGDSGFIVPRIPKAMAECLRQLAENGALRSRMGMRAQEHARRYYSIEANAARYDALYQQLLLAQGN